jgi:uncharacterized LabA/DUF88 family protein
LAETRLKIAVFIDFDNIEIGVKSTLGQHFDVGAVLEAIKERGEVVTKVAYGDWTRAGDYSRSLTQHAIHMVQRNLTPGGDKNGADINLALDALEMAFTHSHINAFVIVGGDSDFMALVEKLKQYDRKVFVVGGRAFTSVILQRNCTEFIAYENLVNVTSAMPRKPGVRAKVEAPVAQAITLVRRALKVLSDREVSPQLGVLKSTLLQLDSTFSEREYGASTFRDFVQRLARAGYVTLKGTDRNIYVELKEGTDGSPSQGGSIPPSGGGKDGEAGGGDGGDGSGAIDGETLPQVSESTLPASHAAGPSSGGGGASAGGGSANAGAGPGSGGGGHRGAPGGSGSYTGSGSHAGSGSQGAGASSGSGSGSGYAAGSGAATGAGSGFGAGAPSGSGAGSGSGSEAFAATPAGASNGAASYQATGVASEDASASGDTQPLSTAAGASPQAEAARFITEVFQRPGVVSRWPLYLRQVKQLLRSVDENFDERRYGFQGLIEALRYCQREGLFRLDRDRQGVLRVYPGPALPRAVASPGQSTETAASSAAHDVDGNRADSDTHAHSDSREPASGDLFGNAADTRGGSGRGARGRDGDAAEDGEARDGEGQPDAASDARGAAASADVSDADATSAAAEATPQGRPSRRRRSGSGGKAGAGSGAGAGATAATKPAAKKTAAAAQPKARAAKTPAPRARKAAKPKDAGGKGTAEKA